MEPIAYTIIRVVFGWIMIMHGLPKWNNGIERVGNAFATNYGLPRWFAALALFFEIVGRGRAGSSACSPVFSLPRSPSSS